MNAQYEKLAKLLRVDVKVLSDLCDRLAVITGKTQVLEKVALENDILINRTLQEIGLPEGQRNAGDVYEALIQRLTHIDGHLYDSLGRPDLKKMSNNCGQLCDVALSINGVPRGYFIKRERAVKMLESYKPQNLLDHFNCKTVDELIEKNGFSSVFSVLRFTQSKKWMHEFFDSAYSDLTADDFEEREVELKVLEPEWLEVAEKFLKKKHHNVSHLKELGIIFIVPLTIDAPGETLRMFTLILHYLNEVPFYTKLIRKYSEVENFAENLKSLLRGDVPEGTRPKSDGVTLRIVQRYLAKDNPDDPRLLEPHVNPEAEHWYRAEGDLGRAAPLIGAEGNTLGFWQGLDFVGDFFPSAAGREQLVSFDLIDLTMTLVEKDALLYHQQEAIWNKIISEFIGRDKLNELIENNMITGFIEIK